MIETAEEEGVTFMPIAGLKSSRWDPCRNKAQYLEQCMGQNDFNLEECQPQLADLKRCCERYQVLLALLQCTPKHCRTQTEPRHSSSGDRGFCGLCNLPQSPRTEWGVHFLSSRNILYLSEKSHSDARSCALQGKSIHCGFDPAVDPPDKHDVPLPDPDIPVTFEPAAPHTFGPRAKVKTAESYTPPVAKDNARKAAKVSLLQSPMPRAEWTCVRPPIHAHELMGHWKQRSSSTNDIHIM